MLDICPKHADTSYGNQKNCSLGAYCKLRILVFFPFIYGLYLFILSYAGYSLRHAYITCIAQVTLKFLNNTMLIYNRRFSLLYFWLLLEFVTKKNRLDDCVNLLTKNIDSLHQRVVEHKNQFSSIFKHLLNKHRNVPKDLDRYFSVLKRCMNKSGC